MLAVEHLHKDFGDVRAVDDVTFSIQRGVTFGLLGPNGAGKTTTMRMILGIVVPDGGSVRWNGERIGPSMRRRFGYLPEERGLYGKMRVRDQISYFGRLHGLVEPVVTQRTSRWIEQLGLSEYAARAAAELSKGNQQKVQIACAAVHEPELLILDEPFAGLDPVNAEMLYATLSELQSRGTTLILSSHQMWQLEHLCDSFCIISAGRNRAIGTLAELRNEWPTRVLSVAPATQGVRAILERIPLATALPSEDGSVRYRVPAKLPLADILRALVASEQVTKFEASDATLQDIYLRTIEASR